MDFLVAISHFDISNDMAFDDLLPVRLQVQSTFHFTPVAVAQRAAVMLAPDARMKVLDVGSGIGKFCIAAALVVPHAEFVGVEFRPHLVSLANELARASGVRNAHFIHSDAFALDWSVYDAFYLFNPFAEQQLGTFFALDRTIDLNPSNYDVYVAGVHQRLARARVGTRVVTYQGYGAPLPLGYELADEDETEPARLELWIKDS
jgi:SAM-dependent methyltransferase